jgi:hypothetical protein
MLVRIRPVHAAAEIARIIKTNSSRWVHEKWGVPFAWQTGYGAFSVSESNVPAVSRYIATQEEHHKKLTFQEEYLAFLKKNKIAFDERYIWSWLLSPVRGSRTFTKSTHGSRRGLHSCAASRLAYFRYLGGVKYNVKP